MVHSYISLLVQVIFVILILHFVFDTNAIQYSTLFGHAIFFIIPVRPLKLCIYNIVGDNTGQFHFIYTTTVLAQKMKINVMSCHENSA